MEHRATERTRTTTTRSAIYDLPLSKLPNYRMDNFFFFNNKTPCTLYLHDFQYFLCTPNCVPIIRRVNFVLNRGKKKINKKFEWAVLNLKVTEYLSLLLSNILTFYTKVFRLYNDNKWV